METLVRIELTVHLHEKDPRRDLHLSGAHHYAKGLVRGGEFSTKLPLGTIVDVTTL